MAHKELDLHERRRIEDLPNAKLPVSRIAAEIGRHRSTVHREIKRNAFGADTEEVAVEEEATKLNRHIVGKLIAQRQLWPGPSPCQSDSALDLKDFSDL